MTYAQASASRRRADARKRLYIAGAAMAVAALVVGGAVFKLMLSTPPTTYLPQGWFDRPASQDPKTWRLAGAGPAAVLDLDFSRAAGRVRIVAEDRADIAVSYDRPADAAAFAVATGPQGASVRGLIEGDCESLGAALPQATIHAPRRLTVRATGAVAGEVGETEALLLSNTGCGRWRTAPAAAELWLVQSGPGEILAASARDARVVAGSRGAVEIGLVSHGLDAVVTGKASLKAADVRGGADVEAWRGGQVRIAGGFTGVARFFAQNGAIRDGGLVGGLTAETEGKSEIAVAQVRGTVSGDTDVQFGRPGKPLAIN